MVPLIFTDYWEDLIANKGVLNTDFRHRVTLITTKSRVNKWFIWAIFFSRSIPQTVGYKSAIDRFFLYGAHSQKNKQQTHHPQLFVLFSSSRYAIYFCYNFQTSKPNELIVSGNEGEYRDISFDETIKFLSALIAEKD